MPKLIILGSPRSGTHHLSEILELNGFTCFEEIKRKFFRHDLCMTYIKEWVVEKCKDHENICFILQRNQLDKILNDIYGENSTVLTFKFLEIVFQEFYFLYLSRKRKIFQAISLSVARQTNKYACFEKNEKNPVYSFDEISLYLDYLRFEREWNDVSKLLKCKNIYYEDLVESCSLFLNDISFFICKDIKDVKIFKYHKFDESLKKEFHRKYIYEICDKFGDIIPEEEKSKMINV